MRAAMLAERAMLADRDMPDHITVFPKKLLKKFIQMYKEMPCLWDKHNPLYKNRNKRRDGITKLTELVQEHDPEATRIHVLRKIESLRSCIRRERKRVKESRKVATSPAGVYTPSLWYYDMFSFIYEKDEEHQFNMDQQLLEQPACSTELAVMSILESEDEEPQEQNVEDSSYDHYEFLVSPVSTADDAEDDTQRPSTSKRNNVNEHSRSTTKKVKSSTEVEDEYDAIGINVAAKLRYLPLNMRIIAEKLINDVLFQAQTNGLSANTVVFTPDPFKTDIN